MNHEWQIVALTIASVVAGASLCAMILVYLKNKAAEGTKGKRS